MLKKTVTRVYTSIQPDYRDNDSESDCNSVVSGDSLDQFCRDADFGSSLNLSTEVSVQPTVKECHNEQPTMAEEKPDDQKTGDEKPSAKADDAPSNIVENIASEYEGSFEIRVRHLFWMFECISAHTRQPNSFKMQDIQILVVILKWKLLHYYATMQNSDYKNTLKQGKLES